jgi:hypothetical protein
MAVAEQQPRKLEQSKQSGFFRRHARKFAAAEALALAVGGGAAAVYDKKSNDAQEVILDLKEANINMGAATELLTVHTVEDKTILGITYRGVNTELRPYDAKGMIGYAQGKMVEAGNKEGVRELGDIDESIGLKAQRAENNFDNDKLALRKLAEENIEPRISELISKIKTHNDNRTRGIVLPFIIPGALLLAESVKRAWYWGTEKRNIKKKNKLKKTKEDQSSNEHDAQAIVKALPQVASTHKEK